MQAQEEAPRQAPLPQPPLRQFPPPPRLRNTFAETVHDAAHGAAVPVIQNYDNVESCCIVIWLSFTYFLLWKVRKGYHETVLNNMYPNRNPWQWTLYMFVSKC